MTGASHPEGGSLIGRRIGIYSRKRVRADYQSNPGVGELEAWSGATLEISGIVRHLFTDDDGDLAALIEDDSESPGHLVVHFLHTSPSYEPGFSDTRTEMYVLMPGQDATADPAPAWERERWDEAISAIKEDEATRARDSEEQRVRAAENRAPGRLGALGLRAPGTHLRGIDIWRHRGPPGR